MMLFSTMWIMLLANKPDFSLSMAVDFEGSNRGDSFLMICVMLSHTSLIVSSTFMACIYKHTHTHREMTFPLTISTSLED